MSVTPSYTNHPPPSSQYWPPSAYHNLDAHDAEVLRSRAISPKVAAARGTRTEGSDMVIPLHNTQGESERDQDQRRPHNPTAGPDGKIRKYLFKAGTQMQVDVQPLSLPCLPNVRVPALIAESALKADATQSAIEPGTFCAMSISGVYGWRSNDMPLTDFGDIPWKIRKRDRITFRRTIYLLFDSDAATNPKVTRARWEFGNFLRRRGARVLLVDVPPTDDGGKQGIDDYLAAGGDLHQLLATAYPLPDIIPAEERADDDAPLSEADRLRQQNTQLRRQVREQGQAISALVRLITTPYLPAKNKAVLASTFARGASQRSRGIVESDGRVKLEARHIANDHRPKPEKGEELSDVNPLDGSRPIVARSAVIPILEDAQERGLLRMETRAVRRQHKNGTYYKDREILVDLPDTLHAFVAPIADYAPAEAAKRKKYTLQEPCQSCGEVHSRTRRTFCNGCGSEYEPDRLLPIPEHQDPDAFVAGESASTKNVEVEFDDEEGVSPVGPVNYLSTKNVEVDSSGASTKNVDPNESPPFAAPWLLDGFGEEAGNDRFTA